MRGVESRTFKSWMAAFWDMEGTQSMGLRLSGFGSPCLLSEHAESVGLPQVPTKVGL